MTHKKLEVQNFPIFFIAIWKTGRIFWEFE